MVHSRFISLMAGIGICICSSLLLGVETATPRRSTDWQKAEALTENAVVQVFSNHTEFNWIEPYKAPRKVQSYGTAFFLNDQGYLLTNFHVIDQAAVQLFIPSLGQKPVDAYVVGACPEADIAYIKVTDTGMASIRKALGKVPFLTLGDSDSLFATEPVLAVGYPMGQRYLKRTAGILAGREYISGKSYMHITAPINPGNSGGPLLNLDGQVVGVNSAGNSLAANIGYIIPIYDAKILMKELKKNKIVRKPRLGLNVNRTTDDHAKVLGNPVPAGVYINGADRNSLAEKAGIQEGDMLYDVNGYEVDSYGDITVNWKTSRKVTLAEYLIRQEPHATLNLTIYRRGKKLRIPVVYKPAAPEPIRTVFADYEEHEIDYEIIGGMCVMQLRENHLNYFDHIVELHGYSLKKKRHKSALIVTRLMPGSVVEKINCFYEGALLEKVNEKQVTTLAELREALKSSKKSGYITLATKDHTATAVSVKDVFADENRLADEYQFDTTPGMKAVLPIRKN